MKMKKNFALFTDEEWIDGLTSTPVNEDLHKYFFETKCASLLRYIVATLYKHEDIHEILGEFFEFLYKDDWHVLKQYKKINGASLNSYIARCAINYFVSNHRKEIVYASKHCDIDTPEALNNFASEDDNLDKENVMKAYNNLEPRDKNVLRLLVLKGKTSLEVADQIWPYVNSDSDWRSLPTTRVQNTIAMIKHRAIARLSSNMKNLSKN